MNRSRWFLCRWLRKFSEVVIANAYIVNTIDLGSRGYLYGEVYGNRKRLRWVAQRATSCPLSLLPFLTSMVLHIPL